MFGWSIEAASFDSRRNRARNASSSAYSGDSSLSATRRSSPPSVARYTTPMPPVRGRPRSDTDRARCRLADRGASDPPTCRLASATRLAVRAATVCAHHPWMTSRPGASAPPTGPPVLPSLRACDLSDPRRARPANHRRPGAARELAGDHHRPRHLELARSRPPGAGARARACPPMGSSSPDLCRPLRVGVVAALLAGVTRYGQRLRGRRAARRRSRGSEPATRADAVLAGA